MLLVQTNLSQRQPRKAPVGAHARREELHDGHQDLPAVEPKLRVHPQNQKLLAAGGVQRRTRKQVYGYLN